MGRAKGERKENEGKRGEIVERAKGRRDKESKIG